MSGEGCAIWPDFEALWGVGARDAGDGSRLDNVSSERAGGPYSISLADLLAVRNLDAGVKARLTTWLVDQRRQGVSRPIVTKEVIEYAGRKRSLSVDERAERLLRYLGDGTCLLGEDLQVSRTPVLARTESTQTFEVLYLMRYLKDREWIEKQGPISPDTLVATVTVDGHRHLAERVATTDTAQAFVAMWFDESLAAVYQEGIEPAIREAGYRPLRIDQKEHINRIDDEIIAEIRRSKFLVADFTQGNEGARGGVYYEAGFAQGLGLPVVFSCRNDGFDDLHFDTNHYNHLAWATPDELREKLKHRILAVIGEGPELNRTG